MIEEEAEEDLGNKLQGKGTTIYNTQHNPHTHTDIATSRLTWPSGRVSEKYFVTLRFVTYQPCSLSRNNIAPKEPNKFESFKTIIKDINEYYFS